MAPNNPGIDYPYKSGYTPEGLGEYTDMGEEGVPGIPSEESEQPESTPADETEKSA